MVFLADKEGRDIFQWKHGDRNTAGYPQYQTYISTKQIRPCRRFFSQQREENHRSFYVDTGWKARRQICSLSLVLDWVRFETNRFQVWPCTPRRPLHEIEILLEFFISSFLIYYLVSSLFSSFSQPIRILILDNENNKGEIFLERNLIFQFVSISLVRTLRRKYFQYMDFSIGDNWIFHCEAKRILVQTFRHNFYMDTFYYNIYLCA